MRRFVGIEIGEDRVPDESSILRFRHLLEEHGLTRAIFAELPPGEAAERLLEAVEPQALEGPCDG
jgi:hypothetical protein